MVDAQVSCKGSNSCKKILLTLYSAKTSSMRYARSDYYVSKIGWSWAGHGYILIP